LTVAVEKGSALSCFSTLRSITRLRMPRTLERRRYTTRRSARSSGSFSGVTLTA
jgi:hypothetical protein